MRQVRYISGTRADFGLMRATLLAIEAHPDLELALIVTGMHLSPQHGDTVQEITAAGLRIAARIPVPLEPATGATMARNIGAMTSGFVAALESDRPDIVLLLGDRGEMLAGAVAGLHLNIPVVHIHGGERSGTVDEPVRHAISKLSHLHFTATSQARGRLIRMGEDGDRVHVTGAPGLDGLVQIDPPVREQVVASYGLDPAKPFALMIYHPVLQVAGDAADEANLLLDALFDEGFQVLALMPNTDAGSEGVRQALLAVEGRPGLALRIHLDRDAFVAAMAVADVLAGNSSAGIIEAASFGTPVLNVGLRQNLRERNANVLDTPCTPEALSESLRRVLAQGRYPIENIYGDGQAAERIATLLATTPLDDGLLMKVNRY